MLENSSGYCGRCGDSKPECKCPTIEVKSCGYKSTPHDLNCHGSKFPCHFPQPKAPHISRRENYDGNVSGCISDCPGCAEQAKIDEQQALDRGQNYPTIPPAQWITEVWTAAIEKPTPTARLASARIWRNTHGSWMAYCGAAQTLGRFNTWADAANWLLEPNAFWPMPRPLIVVWDRVERTGILYDRPAQSTSQSGRQPKRGGRV